MGRISRMRPIGRIGSDVLFTMPEPSSKSRTKSPELTGFFGPARFSMPSGPVLLLLTDAILAALVLVLPFIMGGREAWGHRTLITLALALGCVWCLHRVRTGGRLLLTSVEPLIIAGLLLVWFQTISLSPAVLGTLSGEYERLLPSWADTQIPAKGETQPQFWSTASLLPSETEHALLMLLSYGIIAIVVAQRLTSEDDCHKLLKLVGLSGVLMAAFAVIQLATSNDRFFWFYRQPYTGTKEILKGAFTNRNHFAQFLALSVGPLIWWMLVGRSQNVESVVQNRKGLGPAHGNQSRFGNIVDPTMLILLCAIGGVLVAIMLSLSRGGMVAASLACSVCLAGLWKSGKVKASLALIMVALGVIAIGGLMVFGQEKVEERVNQLASMDADKIDQMNARRTIWKADVSVIKAFPLVGTGVGSHRYVYPIYMEDLADFQGVSFSHAESSYVHLALETGLAGLGLLGLGLLFVLGRIVWNVLKCHEAGRVAALAAVLAGLTGGVVHAAGDFIWYVPAIVVSTIMLGVIGLRLCGGFTPEQGIFMPRICWMAAGVGCALVLCRVQPDLAGRVAGERLWFRYLNTQFDESRAITERVTSKREEEETTSSEKEDSAAQETPSGSPTNSLASYENAVVEKDDGAVAKSLNRRISLLMASLKANPQQPLAAMHLAGRSLELFRTLQKNSDNALDLVNIRDTVMVSKFRTTAEMHAWLKRAFGSPVKLVLLADQMARRSLTLCPVQDEAYEMLISTGFIRDPQDRQRQSMLAQAMRLGQYSPTVRFTAGFALLADGKQKEAIEQWAVVFHSNAQMRRSFCQRIGGSTSVDFILTHFNPSTEELDEVLAEYSKFGRRPEVEKVLFLIAEKTRTEEPASGAVPGTVAAPLGRERHIKLLTEAARTAYDFQLFERSEDLLRIAISCDESSYWPRHALGLLMFDQKKYTEAEELFAWCYEQEPGDTKLEDKRRECRRKAQNQSTQTLPASWQR